MADNTKKVASFWQDGINVLLGLWLIVSPWALSLITHTTPTWNAWVVGAVIAVAAVAALIAFQYWEEWVNVALAAWLIISPWILGYTALHAAVWNQVIVGIVVGALAIWSSTMEHGHSGELSKT